ncbi:hypothetical protein BJY00DRAFT_306868 [Aspergillus carlsbadensis]|nr:hypothetical protein BJY00DRAFT_306868 [Aspergillus carlsbadensis]
MRAKEMISATVPFGMMFGAFCMVLIVGINGVPGRFMGSIFDLDNTHLAISSPGSTNPAEPSYGRSNITAADLHLPDEYSFYLWNYATTAGGKTSFHEKGWDYLGSVNISQIFDLDIDNNLDNANNSSSELHQIINTYREAIHDIRSKIRYAQGFFLPSLVSTLVVVILGIAGAAGYRAPLLAVAMVTGIAFVAALVFAVLITVLIFNTRSKLGPLRDAGLGFTAGNSDLGVVWLCVVHVLAVGVLWMLMAIGVMKYNPLLMRGEKVGGESGREQIQGGLFGMRSQGQEET